MEDLKGFVRFLHNHTSWTYGIIYDAYMIANVRKAKAQTGPENAPKLDEEIRGYQSHIERIINRIGREI